MNKSVQIVIVMIVVLSTAMAVEAETTVNVQVEDNLFLTYEFMKLDPIVYEQALTEFTAERIPQVIAANLGTKNQTFRWGLGAEPLTFDNVTSSIRNSFFIGGSAIISYTLNRTTVRRVYEIKTDWRKFKVNLTDSYSIDFAQRLAKPVSEWEKPSSTTFYYVNREAEAPDIFFTINLPASSGVRVQGDTIIFEDQLHLEDQLIDSPFLILIALVVALAIVLLYRKAR